MCTQGHLVKSLLDPGESTRLLINISLGPYQEQKELGAILQGQDGRTRVDFHYVFSVRASYPLEFSNHSEYINLGTVGVGEAPVTYPPITITRGALPMKWDRVTCRTDDPGLRATLVPHGGNRWLLSLAYRQQKYLGHVVSHVIFTFWRGGTPLKFQMTRPVEIHVRGPIYLSPPALLIGPVPRGNTVESKLRILAVNPVAKLPISVLGIKYSNPREFSARIGGSPERPVVTVGYTAAKSFGDDTGHITISTRYADRDYSFRVGYLAFVPQQSNEVGKK
jgi:hypothetical protein